MSAATNPTARAIAALRTLVATTYGRQVVVGSDAEAGKLTAAHKEARDALHAFDAAPAEPAPVRPAVEVESDDPERQRFEFAMGRGIDFARRSDAWGRLQYIHSHVDATWNGWQKRGAADAARPVAPIVRPAGIALRDQFAMAALPVLLAHALKMQRKGDTDMDSAGCVAWAYEIADSAIEARAK